MNRINEFSKYNKNNDNKNEISEENRISLIRFYNYYQSTKENEVINDNKFNKFDKVGKFTQDDINFNMAKLLLETIDNNKNIKLDVDKLKEKIEALENDREEYQKQKDEMCYTTEYENSKLQEIIDRDKINKENKQLNKLRQLTFFDMKDNELKTIDFTNYVLKNQLKEILEQKRIKQKELANKLEITTATMSNIINNRYGTSIELGFKIAMTLGLQFTDIFYYEEDNTVWHKND